MGGSVAEQSTTIYRLCAHIAHSKHSGVARHSLRRTTQSFTRLDLSPQTPGNWELCSYSPQGDLVVKCVSCCHVLRRMWMAPPSQVSSLQERRGVSCDTLAVDFLRIG